MTSTHVRRHPSRLVSKGRGSQGSWIRWWFVRPGVDLAVALMLLGAVGGPLGGRSVDTVVWLAVLAFDAVAWAVLLLLVRGLVRPRPGFPQGLPLSTRSRLSRVGVASIALVVVVGGLLVVGGGPRAELFAGVIALLSLLRAAVLLRRFVRLHPAA